MNLGELPFRILFYKNQIYFKNQKQHDLQSLSIKMELIICSYCIIISSINRSRTLILSPQNPSNYNFLPIQRKGQIKNGVFWFEKCPDNGQFRKIM